MAAEEMGTARQGWGMGPPWGAGVEAGGGPIRWMGWMECVYGAVRMVGGWVGVRQVVGIGAPAQQRKSIRRRARSAKARLKVFEPARVAAPANRIPLLGGSQQGSRPLRDSVFQPLVGIDQPLV